MARKRKNNHLGLILVLAAMVGAALLIKIWWSGGRRIPWPRYSHAPRGTGGIEAFTDSLEGLKDDSLAVRELPAPADSGIQYQIGAGREVSFILLNLRLSRAAKACGLRSLEAREDSKKQTLDLKYSSGDTLTIRVYVKRKRAEPALVAPKPQMAIIIYNWPPQDQKTAQEFMKCHQTATLATKTGLRETSKTILVALPLEPKNYPRQDPGPGTILVDDSDLKIRSKMERALKLYPKAAGFYALAGSRALEDTRVCTQVLKYCLEKKLIFMEPQPTARSRAGELAGQLGCRYLRPDLTINSKDSKSSAATQLNRALTACREKGKYVILAPASPAFIKVLKETVGEKTRSEFDFPPVSKISQ